MNAPLPALKIPYAYDRSLPESSAFAAERVAAGYDAVAEHYDAWGWQRFWDRNEMPRVRRALADAGGEVGLDLGTGTGRYLGLLGERCDRTVGIDGSRAMLGQARNRAPEAELYRADLRDLPMARGSADVAVVARVLTHVPDALPALSELRRVLRPGGMAVVTDLHVRHRFESTRIRTPEGKRSIPSWPRSPEVVAELAQYAGFDLVDEHVLSATNAEWLPPLGQLSSLDRTGERPVAWMLVLRK